MEQSGELAARGLAALVGVEDLWVIASSTAFSQNEVSIEIDSAF